MSHGYYLFYAGASLGGFQFETMVNSAVINIFVYASTSPIVWTFFFFGVAMQHVGSEFPDHGFIPCTQHWEQGVLNTGPPGKSQYECIFKMQTKKIDLLYEFTYVKVRNGQG